MADSDKNICDKQLDLLVLPKHLFITKKFITKKFGSNIIIGIL